MFIKEQQLFDALKDSFMPDLEKSDNPMARYDCYSLAHNIDIELKCRRKHYDDLLIEKKKYDALLLRGSNFGTDPVYINSTPSGVWVFRPDSPDENSSSCTYTIEEHHMTEHRFTV